LHNKSRQQFNPSQSTAFLGIPHFIASILHFLMQFPVLQQSSPCSAVKTFKARINREFMEEKPEWL